MRYALGRQRRELSYHCQMLRVQTWDINLCSYCNNLIFHKCNLGIFAYQSMLTACVCRAVVGSVARKPLSDYFRYAVSYHQVTVNFTPLLTVSSATRTLLQVGRGRRSPVASSSLAHRQIARCSPSTQTPSSTRRQCDSAVQRSSRQFTTR